ncbi:MAG TPA: TonB family protein [Blastocatellia bacterium]|nr:TonB family protein [Blastocatellia bacterium]
MPGKRLWLALFFALLLVAGFPGAILAQQQTPEQLIARAQEAIQKKKYSDAEKHLKKALSLKKDSPEANLLLGVVYRDRVEIDKSFKHVREAIRLQPNFPDAHYLLAFLYAIENQLDKSAEEVKIAIDQGARFANIYIMKANLEVRFSKHADALDSYEMALQLSQPSDSGYQKVSEQIESLKSYLAFQPLKDEFAKHKGDPAYKRPVLKNRPEPLYSTLARAKKIQGTVRMSVRVNERGVADKVLVSEGIGYGLDEEAVKAVRTAKFSPAMRNGEPVMYWMPVIIEFRIRQ